MPRRILNLKMYPSYFIQLVWILFAPIYLRVKGINFKQKIICYGLPIVSKTADSNISIGSQVVLCSNSRFTNLGVNHPVILRTLHKGAIIHIGNNVGISGATICATKKIIIGDNVMLGANVTIMDTDFHSINPENRRHNSNFDQIKNDEVTIEDNVFVGTNTIILKGSYIGKNSIIGAGSIVTGKIPKNSIAAGNPAKVLKNLDL